MQPPALFGEVNPSAIVPGTAPRGPGASPRSSRAGAPPAPSGSHLRHQARRPAGESSSSRSATASASGTLWVTISTAAPREAALPNTARARSEAAAASSRETKGFVEDEEARRQRQRPGRAATRRAMPRDSARG